MSPLNCNVQVAMFILIERVKHNCQDGIRFWQNKPYPILVVMRRKSGPLRGFGSNIAQVKSVIMIEMCCLQSLCTKNDVQFVPYYSLDSTWWFIKQRDSLSRFDVKKYQTTPSCTAPSIAIHNFFHMLSSTCTHSIGKISLRKTSRLYFLCHATGYSYFLFISK